MISTSWRQSSHSTRKKDMVIVKVKDTLDNRQLGYRADFRGMQVDLVVELSEAVELVQVLVDAYQPLLNSLAEQHYGTEPFGLSMKVDVKVIRPTKINSSVSNHCGNKIKRVICMLGRITKQRSSIICRDPNFTKHPNLYHNDDSTL
ncbi:hypothetical protein AXG93_4866s1010 [Marchantia polymorpha subsp. ruderalis]|uniref:Uncharacterized protein n=1 Tax=Marchantia polymorpha subsp. ruderalis TaxID=1480154 RepID=A0A176WJP9_MARPO|nr:hypothetical protein AXG93_4866s1010 [Marchantia polymorpha subsp. ruderalis]